MAVTLSPAAAPLLMPAAPDRVPALDTAPDHVRAPDQAAASLTVSAHTPTSLVSWADWQGSIRDRATRRLSDVVLLGAHDAAAYGALDIQPPYLEQQDHGAVLPFRWALRGTINDLSITQSVDLRTQAVWGVRMFDLRVSRGTDGQFYFWHGFRTRETLRDGLVSLDAFLAEHPSEYLAIFIRVDGAPSKEHLTEAWRIVLGTLGHRAVHDPTTARFNMSVAAAAGRVLVWANRDAHEFDARMGNYSVLTGAWHNQWKPAVLTQRVTEELQRTDAKAAAPHSFFVLPWTVTPGRNQFVANFFLRWLWPPASPSIRKQTRTLNTHFLPALLTAHGDAVRAKCWAINIDFAIDTDVVYAWLMRANHLQ